MIDLLLTPLPDIWEGRRIDPDFRPMVWLSNQCLRHEMDKDPDGMTYEAFRRFYRDPVPPAEVEDALGSMLRFYTAAMPEPNGKGSGSGSGEAAYDFAYDSGYIVAAFQQAYQIDLTVERVHWWRFRALFSALPEGTVMRQIMRIRTTDISEMEGRERQQYEDRKEAFALPKALKGGPRIVSVEDHDAAFLARFQQA